MTSALRRATAALLCVTVFVSGCATYATRPGPPGAALAPERSPAVRLALRDGRSIEMFEPALRVDSASSPASPDTVIAGLVFDRRLGRRTPAAVPLRDVVAVSARVPDRHANDTLVVVVAVTLFTVGALLLWLVSTCHGRCLD